MGTQGKNSGWKEISSHQHAVDLEMLPGHLHSEDSALSGKEYGEPLLGVKGKTFQNHSITTKMNSWKLGLREGVMDVGGALGLIL
jgi:hypothetical protein